MSRELDWSLERFQLESWSTQHTTLLSTLVVMNPAWIGCHLHWITLSLCSATTTLDNRLLASSSKKTFKTKLNIFSCLKFTQQPYHVMQHIQCNGQVTLKLQAMNGLRKILQYNALLHKSFIWFSAISKIT